MYTPPCHEYVSVHVVLHANIIEFKLWRSKNQYSGTPLVWSPMGQKNLAVLTGDHINESFFYKKMCGHFAMQPKKNW